MPIRGKRKLKHKRIKKYKTEYIIKKDVIGMWAQNEEDAKAIAIETLEFLSKEIVRTGEVNKIPNKNNYEVEVFFKEEKNKELTLQP